MAELVVDRLAVETSALDGTSIGLEALGPAEAFTVDNITRSFRPLPENIVNAIDSGAPVESDIGGIVFLCLVSVVVIFIIYMLATTYKPTTTKFARVQLPTLQISSTRITQSDKPLPVMPRRNYLLGDANMCAHFAHLIAHASPVEQNNDARFKKLVQGQSLESMDPFYFCILHQIVRDVYNFGYNKIPPVQLYSETMDVDVHEYLLRLYGHTQHTVFESRFRLPEPELLYSRYKHLLPSGYQSRTVDTSINQYAVGNNMFFSSNKLYDLRSRELVLELLGAIPQIIDCGFGYKIHLNDDCIVQNVPLKPNQIFKIGLLRAKVAANVLYVYND